MVRFGGIPFEVYDSIEEATCRALKLKDRGKRVRLITMEKDQDNV